MSDNTAGLGLLKALKALVWIVYAIATAAAIILAFAFFLLMFDANVQAGFVEFIYTTGSRFAAPFVGMVEPTELSNGGTLSWSMLFAIAAYLVIAAIVASILNSISRSIHRKSAPAAQPTVAQTVSVQAPAARPVAPVETVAPVAPIVEAPEQVEPAGDPTVVSAPVVEPVEPDAPVTEASEPEVPRAEE